MTLNVCCKGLEDAIEQARKRGYGLAFALGDAPEFPLFYLEYGHGPGSSNKIRFCPWCGTELSTIATQ